MTRNVLIALVQSDRTKSDFPALNSVGDLIRIFSGINFLKLQGLKF